MTPPDPGRPAGDDLRQTDLAARYGARSPARRWLVVAASGLVAAVFLGWLAWAMLHHASPAVSSELVGWTTVDDHQVRARVEVQVAGAPRELGASCTATAFASDHSIVGERSWVPRQGTNQVTVRTVRRATSVEVTGCVAEGQTRPR